MSIPRSRVFMRAFVRWAHARRRAATVSTTPVRPAQRGRSPCRRRGSRARYARRAIVARVACLEENAMETRAFRTRNARDLKFSIIGFGCVPIGEVYELVDEKTAIATVEQAFASGIRVFDTSPHYGNGIAESRLGAGLRRAPRSAVIVSTKIGRVMNPFAKPAPRNPDVFSPGFVGGYAHGPSFDYS